VDGAATYIFNIALQSLKINLGKQTDQSSVKPDVVIGYSQSFLILGLMSFLYETRRRDLLQQIQEFLKNNK
jgi:hypothetical protein